MKQIGLIKRDFSLKKFITYCFVLLMFITGSIVYADDSNQLKIIGENGETILVDAEVTDRIEEIRERIKNITGISANKQFLYFHGKLLEDGNTLQDYSIQIKNNSINLYTHKHKWQYETCTDYDQQIFFFAYCLNDDCMYSRKYGENLCAAFYTEDNGYTGEPFNLVSFSNGISNVTGDKPSDIYYEGRNTTVYTKKTDAPIDAGEYTASITLGGITATLKFLIEKNPRYDLPDVVGVDETIKNKNDGMLINVDSSMEYRKDSEDKYISINDDTVKGLSSGVYYVRYKESTNYYASNESMVIVNNSSNLLSISIPSEQIGYELSVSNSSVEYNGSSELSFKLKDDYFKNNQFVIKINGNNIELDENDKYTIKNIKDNLVITVESIVKADVNNDTKVITCEEAMNSKNWIWSESKKACVYKVSNTSVN